MIENECTPGMAASLLALDKDDPAMTRLMKILIEKKVTMTATIPGNTPFTNYEIMLGGGEEAVHSDALKTIKERYQRQVGKDADDEKMYEK